MIPESITNRQGETLDFTFHPAENSDYLVILGHGLTGNKDRPLLLALADGLSRNGWPCLRISFSGNGESQGRFEDSHVHKGVSDLQCVFEALPHDLKIAYCGHSMGGATGVLTAVRNDHMKVLITLAGMVHTRDFLTREFAEITPGSGCMWDEPECPLSQAFADDLNGIVNTLDAAAAVEIPWLLVHGTADDLIPCSDSTEAFEAAGAIPKQLLSIEDGGHSFDETSYDRIVATIDEWLRTHLSTTTPLTAEDEGG
jgi:pimeloyl-ACP methyl ester carboxylesterase